MFGSLWFQYRKFVLISVLLMVGMAWHAKVEAASLNLTWTEVSTNVDGFKIQRMAADGSLVQIATVGANVASYTNSGLTSGVTYCYTVQAYNSAGTSDPSNGACGTAQAAIVSSSPPAAVSLSVSPTTITAGGTVTASWSGISSPSSTDWIGLYTPGAANSALIDWIFVSCSKTPGSARASGSCPFVMPSSLAPGTYQLRLLANNGDTLLATSNALTVQTASITTLTSQTATTTSTTTSTASSTVSSTSSTTSNPLPTVSYIGGKWTDYSLTLNMQSTSSGAIGVMFRYQDLNNYYRFSWSRSPNLPAGQAKRYQYRRLEKMQNGVLTVLAGDSARYDMGRTYQVEIDAQGTKLKVLINGSLIFSVTDSSIPAGTIALYSYYNQGSIFDNVQVQDLATSNILLADNFNDGNFTGWTIIDDQGTTGGPSVWSASTGALVQSSNVGSNTASKLGTFALYTKGSWTDYRMSVKIKSLDNNALGVMFRYQDQNNYYRFLWGANSDWTRSLEKIENGVLNVLASDTTPYTVGQTYQLQIVTQGNALRVLIDGNAVFSVTDPTFGGGTVALFSMYNQGSVFDDVFVEDLASGNVLLWDNFNDGNFTGWTIIDEGTNGSSAWSVSNGSLVQSSNIYGWSNIIGALGTFIVY